MRFAIERIFGERAGFARRVLTIAGRTLLYGVLAVIFIRGVIGIVRNVAPSSTQTAVATAPAFPALEGEAFAARFTRAYETFDALNPSLRSEALKPYVGDRSDLAGGWDGQGRQVATGVIPSAINIRSDRLAIVSVDVEVDGTRWERLAVPVTIGLDGRPGLAASPSYMPAPQPSAPEAKAEMTEDRALATELTPTMTSFFKAYGSGGAADLGYFAPPGGKLLVGLGGGLAFEGMTSLSVEQGGPARQAIARVAWKSAASGAGVTQEYRLRVVNVSGRWYVEEIGAMPVIPASPGGNTAR